MRKVCLAFLMHCGVCIYGRDYDEEQLLNPLMPGGNKKVTHT